MYSSARRLFTVSWHCAAAAAAASMRNAACGVASGFFNRCTKYLLHSFCAAAHACATLSSSSHSFHGCYACVCSNRAVQFIQKKAEDCTTQTGCQETAAAKGKQSECLKSYSWIVLHAHAQANTHPRTSTTS
jgi:hypothetical protein